ncbi:MAG: ABC transporter permease [Anaerovoracaceae bacterium]|jgi:putative ABC transport system permease protein
MKVVGVVQQKSGRSDAMLSSGIYYSPALTRHLMKQAAASDAVRAQRRHRRTNIFTGRAFGEKSSADNLPLQNFFSVDAQALQNAFRFHLDGDTLSGLAGKTKPGKVNLSGGFNAQSLAGLVSERDLQKLTQAAAGEVTDEEMQQLFRILADGWLKYARRHVGFDPQQLAGSLSQYLQSQEAQQIMRDFLVTVLRDNADRLPDHPEQITVTAQQWNKLVEDLLAGYAGQPGSVQMPDADDLADSFGDYLGTAGAQKTIGRFVSRHTNSAAVRRQLQKIGSRAQKKVQRRLTTAMNRAVQQIQQQLFRSIGSGLRSGALNPSSLLSVDPNAFAGAIRFHLSREEIEALASSLLSSGTDSYDANLEQLGCATVEDPQTIRIYPRDFDSKMKIEDLIASYNKRQKAAGAPEKVIAFTDFYGNLLKSITNIVGTISQALIALVAVSLIVSSIMIAVITHISVLERRKEIGILRAIGASRHNIAAVFNAETFLTGLLAGGFGIGIAYLLLIPGNYIIHNVIDHPEVTAMLPPLPAAALVALSIGLNVLSGLIPAGRAARSDPVAALRGE